MVCASQFQIDFWTARLQQKIALLAAYDAAIVAVSSGVQSYTLNTGQTTQTVTRSSLGQMRSAMADLEREIEQLHDKLYGCDSRTVYVRPIY